MRTTIWQISAVMAPLALGVLSGCGSDLTCGAGTTKQGEKCVAAAPMGTAGDGGNTLEGGTAGDAPPSFDGITSIAPASDSSLQITWDPALDDFTEPEDIRYRIYVGTATGEQNFGQPTAVSPPGARALVVGSLQSDTEYFIVVRAVDSADLEDENVVEESGIPESDTEPPTFAGATSADPATSNSVEISWDPAEDDKTPPEGISYTVRWSDKQGGAVQGAVGVLTSPGETSAIVEGLPKPVTAYYFYVQARDAAGNVDTNTATVSGETGPDVTAPRFAGCVSVAEPGATRATAGWEPALDDTTSPEEMTYNIYAFELPVDEQTPFGAPDATFTGGVLGVVDNLSPKTVYYLVCRAADSSGNEDQNIAFREVLTKEDSEPPVFQGITNVVVDSTSAELTWEPGMDDQTLAEEIMYLVYQSTEADPVNTGILITPGPVPGASNFTVTDLDSRTQYYWAVLASDRAGNIDDNAAIATEFTLVSFANDVQPIFTTSCAKTNCHLGEEAMQGMRLEEGYAYLNTFEVNSVWNTSLNPTFGATRLHRIEPNDPSRSFLFHKINHTEISGVWGALGSGMPKDIAPQKLPQPTLDTIETWILEGARNN